MTESSEFVQICPRCYSPDINVDFSNPGAIEYGILNMYHCNHCSFVGRFFPEIEQSKLPPVKDLDDVPSRNITNTVFD